MFGTLLHPSIELWGVLTVISILFVTTSAIAENAMKKCNLQENKKGNHKFVVGGLVISSLSLTYCLAFLVLTYIYPEVVSFGQ